MTHKDDTQFEEVCLAHRRYLWGLAYRITGSGADADDVVQETFFRLYDRQPEHRDSLRPWLIKVATNLATDRLRDRKREMSGYVGCWLPEPVPGIGAELEGDPVLLRESAGFAFLFAVEVLSPIQRAVLILREVFELSTRETAEAVEISEANVRTSLHRARNIVQGAVSQDTAGDPSTQNVRNRVAASQLFAAILAADVGRVADLLARDVRAVQDAGGTFTAATRVVRGPGRVSRLLLGIAQKHVVSFDARELPVNGTLGWLVHHPASGRLASRSLMVVSTNSKGLIDGLYTVIHPGKLDRVCAWLGLQQDTK